MIGWLSGEVVSRSGSVVILSVHGVGYEISVAGDVAHLSVGANTDLYIHSLALEMKPTGRFSDFFCRRLVLGPPRRLGLSATSVATS